MLFRLIQDFNPFQLTVDLFIVFIMLAFAFSSKCQYEKAHHKVFDKAARVKEQYLNRFLNYLP